MDTRTPVTIVCGFLGAGKTTCLNHVIRSLPNIKFAVVENEFGEVAVDDAIIESTVLIKTVTGCACCTGYAQLVEQLDTLRADAVLVEASGLSSPLAIARALCVERGLRQRFRLDSVVTLIDTLYFSPESQIDQIMLADRVVLNKIDLVSAERVREVEDFVRSLNETALVVPAERSRVDPYLLVNARSFSVDRILYEVDPSFLDDDVSLGGPRWHDPSLTSVSFKFLGEMNVTMLHAWLAQILGMFPDNFLRYKGVLAVRDMGCKFVLQGVRGRFDGGFDAQRVWKPDEPRECRFIFIGRHLNKDALARGFLTWSSGPSNDQGPVTVVA
ncbi:hypothetical protein CTAYLR_009230 [Chrysophaeum taylorii]|uniref:CobW C-terminal domain-containing protein n=1 Tax=Chrysophaeum taylorii TaxID=2483200 RepID=A0AAD7UFL9_9STRA|nr:hypothetical protein CTAYLR_009230 [Chrysophaeum taylorii]